MKLTFSNLLLFFTETQLLENNRLAILQAFFISVNILLDLDSNHHCSVFQRRRKFSRKLKLKGGNGKIEPFSEVYWIRTPKSIFLKAATPATPEILWQEKKTDGIVLPLMVSGTKMLNINCRLNRSLSLLRIYPTFWNSDTGNLKYRVCQQVIDGALFSEFGSIKKGIAAFPH